MNIQSVVHIRRSAANSIRFRIPHCANDNDTAESAEPGAQKGFLKKKSPKLLSNKVGHSTGEKICLFMIRELARVNEIEINRRCLPHVE